MPPSPADLLLAAKDAGDLVALTDDESFWLELGEAEKAALRPQAEAMVRAGMDAADETFRLAPQIGFHTTLADQAVREAVDGYLDEWWLEIAASERRRLRGSFQRLANGELPGGFPQLRREVQQLYGRDRGRIIAETETTRLWAIGNEVSMQQAGVAEYEWRTAEDERVDSVCTRLNGQTYPVGGTGPRPPAHPRCRCAIVPVVPEREPLPEPVAEPAPQPTPTGGEVQPPTPELHGLRPVDRNDRTLAAIRANPERADWINSAVSDSMRGLSPEERAKILRNDRALGIMRSNEARAYNSWDGRIEFEEGFVDDELSALATGDDAIARLEVASNAARGGWRTTRHELVHGISTRSRSHNFRRLRPRNPRERDRFRREQGFQREEWTDPEIDQRYAEARYYSGNDPDGWSAGRAWEEGTTDAIATDDLRFELIDRHGVSQEIAESWVRSSQSAGYAPWVRAVRQLGDEALTLRGASFTNIMEGRALDTLGRERAAWIRALGNEVPAIDRADATARFLMEKWTAEFGPVAFRDAEGRIRGTIRAFTMRDTLTTGLRTIERNRRAVNAWNDTETWLSSMRSRWQEAVEETAAELAEQGLAAEAAGVLALPEEFAVAAEIPESMAASLPRRIELVLE